MSTLITPPRIRFATLMVPLLLCSLWLASVAPTRAASVETELDRTILTWARECREEVIAQLDLLLSSGQLSSGQLFDTFYIPIPDTEPQKYRTQYDRYTDEVLRPILDRYLKMDPHIVFFIAVDRNGYLPTHNTPFAQPLTGDPAVDSVRNRTKRIFNDRTGLAAARNREEYLLQHYDRDTGEQMADLSIPILISNRHWGAIRVGYRRK